jgi:hypothetical protein
LIKVTVQQLQCLKILISFQMVHRLCCVSAWLQGSLLYFSLLRYPEDPDYFLIPYISSRITSGKRGQTSDHSHHPLVGKNTVQISSSGRNVAGYIRPGSSETLKTDTFPGWCNTKSITRYRSNHVEKLLFFERSLKKMKKCCVVLLGTYELLG